MLQELLQKISLFNLLHRIDNDLARGTQEKRCPHCKSPLHYANYERKPRGGPENIPDKYLIRFSLCCSNGDCRKRTLPPSCLFMGRKVYWGCVILIVMTLKQNRPGGINAGRVMELFGIPRQTLKRWVEYFKEEYPYSAEWQRLRGRVSGLVRDDELPGALVNYFIEIFKSGEAGIICCLKFLVSGI